MWNTGYFCWMINVLGLQFFAVDAWVVPSAALFSPVQRKHLGPAVRRSYYTTSTTTTTTTTSLPLPVAAASLLCRLATGNDQHDATGITPDATDATDAVTTTTSPPTMIHYQRVFYRFTPMSDVEFPNAIVVEERCRYRPVTTTAQGGDSSVVPFGPPTLILRDGMVEDGEIGDELFTWHYTPGGTAAAGTDRELETTIATAMFLAGNPDRCHGSLLQVGAGHGLDSFLGCVGAAISDSRRRRRRQRQPTKESHGDGDGRDKVDNDNNDDVVEDILTISKKADGLLPKELQQLTISDASTADLEMALRLAKTMGLPMAKLNFAELDWRIVRVRNNKYAPTNRLMNQQPNSGPPPKRESLLQPEFSSIIAAGLSFTFPEAKGLARTVAYHLQPSAPALTSVDWKPIPRFAIVTPDRQADCLVNLRHLLERGYKMATATQYLKLEKIAFHVQKTTQPESTLDDLDLEVSEVREVLFTALTAQHHPDYRGGGSGELFFPMETGAYDNQGRSGEAAPLWDGGRTPW